jgi:glycosyltransferase involved in cell wall biosynthesis
MDIITFIIPTIGRTTLICTIESLLYQSVRNWNAIIIFDGLKSTIDNIKDDRIKILEIEKTGNSINGSGFVRNIGIKMANTKWIAFLDDDDTISQDYIETFYNELNLYPFLDVLIFRMGTQSVELENEDIIIPENTLDNGNMLESVVTNEKMTIRIIPKLNTDNFYVKDVGISFILKKEIFQNKIEFNQCDEEDFILLDKIRNDDYKIIISPHIKYFIKSYSYDVDEIKVSEENRVFINIGNPLVTLLSYALLSNI